jgi:formylmethanofuran dehydrogenase subunit C
MSLRVSLQTIPAVPLEAEGLCPDRVHGLTSTEVAKLLVYHGNEKAALGDFFTVRGHGDSEIRLEGDLKLVKHIGAGMTRGRIAIQGSVGSHLGAGMSGGEIRVDGDAGDWVGPEMKGGRIVIEGNAGHMVGSAYRGSPVGMREGEIIVKGRVGNEAGNAMRGGLIAIGGDSADFAGVNMLAGTIIVLGKLGIRTGAGMKRGSIVSMHEAPVLPTFTYACTYHPLYLRFYLLHLLDLGLKVAEPQLLGRYRRYSGDAVELNRGELLFYAGS